MTLYLYINVRNFTPHIGVTEPDVEDAKALANSEELIFRISTYPDDIDPEGLKVEEPELNYEDIEPRICNWVEVS